MPFFTFKELIALKFWLFSLNFFQKTKIQRNHFIWLEFDNDRLVFVELKRAHDATTACVWLKFSADNGQFGLAHDNPFDSLVKIIGYFIARLRIMELPIKRELDIILNAFVPFPYIRSP